MAGNQDNEFRRRAAIMASFSPSTPINGKDLFRGRQEQLFVDELDIYVSHPEFIGRAEQPGEDALETAFDQASGLFLQPDVSPGDVKISLQLLSTVQPVVICFDEFDRVRDGRCARTVERAGGQALRHPAFARHLTAFATDRGPVLQKSGRPQRFRYRLRDPLLRPYVLMRGVRDGFATMELLERVQAADSG